MKNGFKNRRAGRAGLRGQCGVRRENLWLSFGTLSFWDWMETRKNWTKGRDRNCQEAERTQGMRYPIGQEASLSGRSHPTECSGRVLVTSVSIVMQPHTHTRWAASRSFCSPLSFCISSLRILIIFFFIFILPSTPLRSTPLPYPHNLLFCLFLNLSSTKSCPTLLGVRLSTGV